jgi:hypothetical protein
MRFGAGRIASGLQMDYRGRLTVAGDVEPLIAILSLTDTHLSLTSADTLIGRWPLASCKVDPDGNAFAIHIEGDVAQFVPDQLANFTKEVLERWPPARLSDAVRAVRRAVAGAQPESESVKGQHWWKSWESLDKTRRAQVLVLVGGVLVIVIAAVIIGGPDAPPLSTAPGTQASAASPDSGVFDLTLFETAENWNQAASRLNVELFINELPRALRMEVVLSDRLTLFGTADPATKSTRTLMLSSGPAEGEDAQEVLAAWGVLIATMNPALTPEGRRSVLTRLGVDFDAPLSFGFSRETVEGEVRYWLQSGLVGDRVHFGAEPVP